jgi:serine/threonine-protein kinase PpkA
MKLEIPGYTIRRQLAEGGMATVYLAVQTSLDRPVALKVLKNTDNPAFSSRFLEEGRTVAALAHPNIVTIYDVGIVGDIHFISMEYVDGGDLEARIRQGLSPVQAVEITRQLAACLKFVHQRGIVHRDIKPGNVLFRRNDTPLLTDFGIAKQLQNDSRLTQDGTAIGSPYYLSPEQSKGEEVDARADIYSLGILVFEMLAGHRPFEGKTPIETILKHHKQPLPALTGYVARYNGLLARMAAKAPEQRFADCGALLAFLHREFPAGASTGAESRGGQTQTLVVEAGQAASKKSMKKRMARKRTPTGKGSAAKSTRKPLRGRKKRGATPGKRSAHNVRKRSALLTAVVSGVLIVPLAYLNRTNLFGLDGDANGSGAATPVFIWNGKETSYESRIRQLLHTGRQRLQQDRLTTPEGDNAHEFFRQALRLDPENPAARQGLIDVAERYAVLAEAALQRGKKDKVRTFLERGLVVVPGYPRLGAVQRRLGGMEEEAD